MKPWEKSRQSAVVSQKPWERNRSADVPEQMQQIQDQSSWMERFGTGAADPIFGLSQLAERGMSDTLKSGINTANEWLHGATGGILGREQGIDPFLQQREIEYNKALPQGEGFDEARMLGNVASGLVGAKGMGIGAPSSMGRAMGLGATEGAALGAANPVVTEDFWGDKLKQTGTGAIGGAAGGALGQGISRLIAPKAVDDVVVKELMDEGITLTPGQVARGIMNKIEQQATSVPFLGKYIEKGRQRSQDDFNKVALNKVVSPVGGKVNNIGHDGIVEAQKIVNDAYKAAEDYAPTFRLDDAGKEEITGVIDFVKYLPDSETKRFAKFFNDKIKPRFDSNGEITSKTYKQMASELRKQSGASSIEQETAGGAFKQLESIFRENAKRVNPGYADRLKNADKAFAQLRTVENAANKGANNQGVFTPSQLISASKTADKSKGKNLSARGGHELQQFASKAQQVIGDTVPDSGTAGRNAITGALAGGGAFEPMSAAMLGGGLYAGSQAYRPAMQKFISELMVDRPEIALKMAKELGIAAPIVGASQQLENR